MDSTKYRSSERLIRLMMAEGWTLRQMAKVARRHWNSIAKASRGEHELSWDAGWRLYVAHLNEKPPTPADRASGV